MRQLVSPLRGGAREAALYRTENAKAFFYEVSLWSSNHLGGASQRGAREAEGNDGRCGRFDGGAVPEERAERIHVREQAPEGPTKPAERAVDCSSPGRCPT